MTGQCVSCEHCDTREATSGPLLSWVSPGFCTKDSNWFNGDRVPVWLSGCPDYAPRTQAQGDGDAGEQWELGE